MAYNYYKMASTNNKNANTHLGRPDMKELLQKSDKEVVSTLGRHEAQRGLGEMAKAGVVDVLVDLGQIGVSKFLPQPWDVTVRTALEMGEMRFEHAAEKEQGKEHEDNMKVIIEKTLSMYRQLETSGREDLDTKKVKKTIHRLEVMEAWMTNDVSNIKFIKEKLPFAVKGLNAILKAIDSNFVQAAKSGILEVVDFVPFACPESVMEIHRMTQLKAVLSMYNAHPDVTPEEKVKLSMGMIRNAFNLQQLRIKAMFKGANIGDLAKAYGEQYTKTAKATAAA